MRTTVGPLPGSGRAVADRVAKNQRRLALLRRCGLFSASLNGAKINRATTTEELRQAFRIVHDAFVEAGYINPCPGGMRIRSFEAAGESEMFVAKKDGTVIGALGLIVDSPDLGLPSDSVFKAELDRLRTDGIKLS